MCVCVCVCVVYINCRRHIYWERSDRSVATNHYIYLYKYFQTCHYSITGRSDDNFQYGLMTFLIKINQNKYNHNKYIHIHIKNIYIVTLCVSHDFQSPKYGFLKILIIQNPRNPESIYINISQKPRIHIYQYFPETQKTIYQYLYIYYDCIYFD